MKDILITIFSISESIYLAYWINLDDSTFHTINFPEQINQTEIDTPFLSDVEKLIHLFPKKEFSVSLIRNESLTVIVFSKEEEYLPVSKNIFSIVQGGLLRNKRNEIESYLENFFSDTVDADVQEVLSKMYDDMMNYSSFISVYDYDSDKLVASTLHKKSDENKLAKEVFIELKRLELIKKIDLEVEVKKIGSLQAFFFYFRGLVFVIYAINIQINTGIIRLKLKSFLKNKSLLQTIGVADHSQSQKFVPKIVEVDFTGKNIITFQMRVKSEIKN